MTDLGSIGARLRTVVLVGTATATAAALNLATAPAAHAIPEATGHADAQAVEGDGILAILNTGPACDADDTALTAEATPTGRCGAGLAFEGEQVATFTQEASAGNGTSSANAGTAPLAIEDFHSLDLNGVLDGLDAIDSGTVLDPVVQALNPLVQDVVRAALQPLIDPINDALQSTLAGVEQALPLSVEIGAITAQCTATADPLVASGSTEVAGIDIVVELGSTQVRAPIDLGTGPNAPLTVTAPQDLVDGVLEGLRDTLEQTLGGALAPLNVLVTGLQDTVIDTLLEALEPSLLTALTDALRGLVSGTVNIQEPVSPSSTGEITVRGLELTLAGSTGRLANAHCGPNTAGAVDDDSDDDGLTDDEETDLG
ncbi:hypothetical protein F0U44_22045, partial [Nocardioides humilatus]